MTLAEWRSLTQANNPNLTRAVLAFLGVGEGLSPRQQRLGQRVALIVRPDNELLRKWTPSRTHAVCLFNAVPPHGSTFAGTAAPSPDFDVLGRLAPTLLLTDVEDFGRIATRLTEEDPRWRKLEALAMPHFPEVTKAATLDDAVAAAIASLNSERPRSPAP